MLITDTALTAFSDDFWAVMELVMQFALRLSVGDTPFGVFLVHVVVVFVF
nr:hypothetical protein [Bifidobacterium catenulatum]